MEGKIRKMLVPELELELLDVNSLQWEELSQSQKQEGEMKAEQLLQSTINKILEVESEEIRTKVQERQRKNAFKYRCVRCPNQEQTRFVEIEGSIICKGVDDKQGCGYELVNYKPHEGNFYRSFEGEDDRSHHGKPYNPLYSEAWNSRISSSPEGIEVKAASKIKAAIAKVEDDLNNVNRDSDDRRTRDSYRDKHKSKAFESMKDVVSNLSLHAQVEKRAQYLFAVFRDDRDRVQRDKLVIAACLVIGYRENENEKFQESNSISLPSSSLSSSLSSYQPIQPTTGSKNDKSYEEAQEQLLDEIEVRNLERKRMRDASEQYKPLKQYNEDDVFNWFSYIISEKLNGIEIENNWKTSFGEKLTSSQVASIVAYLTSHEFITKLMLKLKKKKTSNRTLGQCLLMSNAAVFNVCECEPNSSNCFCSEIAQHIFQELKVAKERDMLQLSLSGTSADAISRQFGLIRKKPRE